MTENIDETQRLLQKQTNKKDTGQPQNMIDLQFTFGEDGGQDTLADLDLHVFSYVSTDIQSQKERLKSKYALKQLQDDDLIIVLKFDVEQGREKQGIQYFQKGLDQSQEDSNISDLQKLFRRPKSAGRVELKQGKGYVLVLYYLYNQYLNDAKEFYQTSEGTKFNIDFGIKTIIKGYSTQSKKSFINLKPDYVNMRITSNKMKANQFTQFALKHQIVMEQETGLEFYKLFQHLEVARMSLKLNSLRRIFQFFDEIQMQGEQGEKKEKDHSHYDYKRLRPLSNKGIFKESAEVSVLFSNKLAIEGKLKYKNQETFFRLAAVLVRLAKDFDSNANF